MKLYLWSLFALKAVTFIVIIPIFVLWSVFMVFMALKEGAFLQAGIFLFPFVLFSLLLLGSWRDVKKEYTELKKRKAPDNQGLFSDDAKHI
ncbi:hypothetical protein ACFQPF_02740 [Fictibacillus iocasae]|uniref:Uncharacterized protein n=1 Tax=Fictibacillus iocasae TaxID=2715437 RepID=A0ABW2NMR1_9BACL